MQQFKHVTLELDFASKDATLLRHGALVGMGIALVPESIVQADIASGTLLRVLPAFRPADADGDVSIVYPGRRHLSAKTRTFVEFAIDYFMQTEERVSPRREAVVCPA